MCTECLTEQVRQLAANQATGRYWTLRVGPILESDGIVAVVGNQEAVATFQLHLVDEEGIPVREATAGDDPTRLVARLQVLNPADWARFLVAYADGDDSRFDDLVEKLEAEATTLFPMAVEACRRASQAAE